MGRLPKIFCFWIGCITYLFSAIGIIIIIIFYFIFLWDSFHIYLPCGIGYIKNLVKNLLCNWCHYVCVCVCVCFVGFIACKFVLWDWLPDPNLEEYWLS